MKNILRTNQLAEYLEISRSTIWRWEKNPDFPKKIKLGTRSVGWRKSDIDRWIENCIIEK